MTAVEHLALEVPAGDDISVDLHETVAEQLPTKMGPASKAARVT
jgi:hypothetical protein